jgi:acyl-[acyl carrier protein]--UDP-N-acetylglucosamine O-acyltransferase
VVIRRYASKPTSDGVDTAGTKCAAAQLAAPWQDKKYAGEPTWLLLGARSVVREHATLSRGTGLGGGVTRIGDGCLIMSGVHVAHDCVLGAGVVLSSGASLAGHVAVGDGAIIGGHAGVLQRVCVGAHAMVSPSTHCRACEGGSLRRGPWQVGGMSAVRADVLPFSLVQGNPAATLGLNVVGLRRAGAHNHTIWLLRAALRFCLAGADGGGASQQLHGGARDQAQAPGWTWQSTVLAAARCAHGRLIWLLRAPTPLSKETAACVGAEHASTAGRGPPPRPPVLTGHISSLLPS